MCDGDPCTGRPTPGYRRSSDARSPQSDANRRLRSIPLRRGLRGGRCAGNSTNWRSRDLCLMTRTGSKYTSQRMARPVSCPLPRLSGVVVLWLSQQVSESCLVDCVGEPLNVVCRDESNPCSYDPCLDLRSIVAISNALQPFANRSTVSSEAMKFR